MFEISMFFAQKSMKFDWGASEVATFLIVIVVGLSLYSGILKLAKLFFPEKFTVNLKKEIEDAIVQPADAKIPDEVLTLLRSVNESIQNKENSKRQEAMISTLGILVEKVNVLYEWHEPEEKFGKPPWYCVCAINKTKPDWDGLAARIEKIDKDSEGIRTIVDSLKRAHKEWSESVITTNRQISQAMTSLIGYLSTMQTKVQSKDEDNKV